MLSWCVCVLMQDSSIQCSMEHINPNDIDINARRRRQSSSVTEINSEVSNIL